MSVLKDLNDDRKWLDEQVLRQYTKLTKRFNLDKGRKKYFIGKLLEGSSVFICPFAHVKLGFPGVLMFYPLAIPDVMYNWEGILGAIEDDTTSDSICLNHDAELYKKYNRTVRLPITLTGLAFTGKFGIDLFDYATKGKPLEQDSYYYLQYGLGLLSLASSMYIKDTNPKLLKKATLREKAYNWLSKKVQDLLQPLPEPVPVSVRTYSTLEDNL